MRSTETVGQVCLPGLLLPHAPGKHPRITVIECARKHDPEPSRNMVIHARLAEPPGPMPDWNDQSIEALHVTGNSIVRRETGAMMQSTASNARGMTCGWLAARHAAGRSSDLLEREIAHLGRCGRQAFHTEDQGVVSSAPVL